jgi:antitoxin (DNA-binding transcriptional repressor) of toxin-antitoxin stability system
MDRTITQRELRDSSTEIVDALEAGETIIITRHGIPVGELRPLGRRRLVPINEVLVHFANCPPMDYQSLRDDLDSVFGDQRI